MACNGGLQKYWDHETCWVCQPAEANKVVNYSLQNLQQYKFINRQNNSTYQQFIIGVETKAHAGDMVCSCIMMVLRTWMTVSITALISMSCISTLNYRKINMIVFNHFHKCTSNEIYKKKCTDLTQHLLLISILQPWKYCCGFHFPMFGFGDKTVVKFEPHWVPIPYIIIKEHIKKICFKSWFTKTYVSEKCNTFIEYNEILDPWSISVMHVLPETSRDISL